MPGLLDLAFPNYRSTTAPGYRVYYQQKGSRLILLLAGGEKSSQSRDIEEALMLSRQIKEDE